MSHIVISADGTVEAHEGIPTLEDLQRYVGGYIEAVSLVRDGDDEAIMWLNEEGKLNGLPANEKATRLAREFGGVGRDVIVGNAVMTGPADEDGETMALPETWRLYLMDGAHVSEPV